MVQIHKTGDKRSMTGHHIVFVVSFIYSTLLCMSGYLI